MSVPGINLLKLAQTVIAKQTYVWYKYNARVKNAIGKYETTFDAGVTLRDSLQAAPKELIRSNGLDLDKDHLVLYTSTDTVTLVRGGSSDIIEFGGVRWQAMESNDWLPIDGWEGVIFTKIGLTSEPFPGNIV